MHRIGKPNLERPSFIPKFACQNNNEQAYGISETEFRRDFTDSVEDFARNRKLSNDVVWKLFKDYYDGYHFSAESEGIYNPFSVLLAFDANEIGTYWNQTGTPDYLAGLLKRHVFPLTEIDGARRTKNQLADISIMRRDIIPLLYQAGYLTIGSYDDETRQFILRFPNIEVKEGFWSSLWENYLNIKPYRSTFDLHRFADDIRKGQPEDFMLRLQSLIADTSSETEPDKEIHFQNIMAIIFKMIGMMVRTEIHSARGRADMIAETPGFVYIFEFKTDSTPSEAIKQIHSKGYAEPYAADPRQKFIIGANFSTVSRALTDWIIE